MIFELCTLHNILHSFNGLGELGADVHSAALDGLHDPWVTEPLTDFTNAELWDQGGNGSLETDASHERFKEMLLRSFRASVSQ